MIKKGLTLLEVLISLGIITFGLLSVSALFVVGAHNIREAEIQERARVTAEEAFNDIKAYGFLDVETWRSHNPVPLMRKNSSGQYVTIRVGGKFNFPMAQAMRNTLMNPHSPPNEMERLFGSVWVLDPVVISRVHMTDQMYIDSLNTNDLPAPIEVK